MTVRWGKTSFDHASDLIVRDLFEGGPAAPKRLKRKTDKRKGRGVEAEKLARPKPPMKHYSKIDCPCCRRKMDKPDLDTVIDYYEIPKLEEAILRAVWKGRGFPVPTERIFDLMYFDDPDGGPGPGKMYRAFKVGVHKLRRRLEGSGITVENVGYRRGYRLILGEK